MKKTSKTYAKSRSFLKFDEIFENFSIFFNFGRLLTILEVLERDFDGFGRRFLIF